MSVIATISNNNIILYIGSCVYTVVYFIHVRLSLLPTETNDIILNYLFFLLVTYFLYNILYYYNFIFYLYRKHIITFYVKYIYI